jgi:hypothetical protein
VIRALAAGATGFVVLRVTKFCDAGDVAPEDWLAAVHGRIGERIGERGYKPRGIP